MKRIILATILLTLPLVCFAQNLSKNIKISFQYAGGYSPYEYINLEIYGNGNTYCILNRYKKEIKIDYNLSKQIVNRLIEFFQTQAFLELTQEKVKSMEQPVSDVGKTTLIYYEDDEIKRELSFVYVHQEILNQISSLCWKIFNQIIYLYDIEEAIETNKNLQVISSLQSCVRSDDLINAEEYTPLLIKVVSDEKLRDTAGGFAAQSISEIAGMDIEWITTSPPYDNTINAQKLLNWWEENKSKNRLEWLQDNMHKGEWKAACYLAKLKDNSSIPYLVKSLDSNLAWTRRDSYISLCEITGREISKEEAEFWYYSSDNEERKDKIEKWNKWLVENKYLNLE